MLLDHGLTSSALLTPGFSIYARNVNMQCEDNGQFLCATELMHKYFDSIFDDLPTEDAEQIEQMKNDYEIKVKANTNPKILKKLKKKIANKEIFNSDRFKYARWQSIVKKCRVTDEKNY